MSLSRVVAVVLQLSRSSQLANVQFERHCSIKSDSMSLAAAAATGGAVSN